MTTAQKAVLVTGANGFVGSRLCRWLKSAGYRVLAGVRQGADLRLLGDLEVEYRYGDITKPDSLPELVREVDYIVHNAGITKTKQKEMFAVINEQGTRQVLEAALKHNRDVKRVVYISSVAAAGPSTPGRPNRESDLPQPITTYGQSKLAGEKAALSFADRLDVIALRPPGVYGPGDKAIFAIFQTVYGHVKPLIGNPKRKLQLVHVDDLCFGVEKALTADVRPGGAYFIAEKQSYTYGRLIDIVAEAAGRFTLPLYLPSPLFRAVATVSEFSFRAIGLTPMLTREKARELNACWEMDVTRAREELGFESQISFADGARQTYDWYLKEGWL